MPRGMIFKLTKDLLQRQGLVLGSQLTVPFGEAPLYILGKMPDFLRKPA